MIEHGTRLPRVLGGPCGVAPPGRGVPDQDARFRLLEPPAFGLFDAMMVTAQRAEVTLACAAAFVPGHGMVEVASGRGSPAPGCGAPGVACLYQVLEFAAGPVTGFAVLVIAVGP